MWLIPWARTFARDLNTLVFRSDRELAAVVPLYPWRSASGARKLLLLGAGISDYLDLLVRNECAPAVIPAMQQWLQENENQWDRCDFEQIPVGSALLSLRDSFRQQAIPCPVLDLHPGSLETAIPARQLEKLHYYRRRAARQGRFAIRAVSSAECAGVMHTLFHLHALRWLSQGTPGVLQDPAVQQFHLHAAEELAMVGALRLYAAELDSRIFGVLYAFASHGRTCFYLSGFDPAFDKLSPGTLLIGHAIEQALHDSTSFDFLSGQEKYKYTWGARDTPTWRISLDHPVSFDSTPAG